jgi:lipoyl(octanoyl) transferase
MIAPQQLGTFEALMLPGTQQRKVLLEDWTDSCNEEGSSLVDFRAAWDIQKEYLQQHMARLDIIKENENDDENSGFLRDSKNDDRLHGVDRVIMLEHEPVYTLGTASDASLILNESSTIPVVRMDRGGEVTFHGPGQLTVYPVLDLRNYRQDIHWYMRALEESVLVALQKCLEQHGSVVGAEPQRDQDFTGVWVPGFGKVAAVGVKCRRWVTQHGVAINVESLSLEPFSGIVPCGLTGSEAQVTCVNDLVERPVTVSQMAQYMKEAMEIVFEVQLVRR